MNNIHLFPSDTYGLMVSYYKEPQITSARRGTPVYLVTCVTNPRTLKVPVPVSLMDLVSSKCSDCIHNSERIKDKLAEQYRELPEEVKKDWPYASGWINNQYTQIYQIWRNEKKTIPPFPPPCQSGLQAIKNGDCHVITIEEFKQEANKVKVEKGLAAVNLPKLALVQSVLQKANGNLSIASAGQRPQWKLYGFSPVLPEPWRRDAQVRYEQLLQEWKDSGGEYRKPTKDYLRKGMWLAPFTMANVYDDGSICWGQVRGLNKFKTHRSVFSNFFGNVFNSDLSSSFQKSVKYTLENFDINKVGRWRFSPPSDSMKTIMTPYQYEGMFVTDRQWLLDVVPGRYHCKIGGKRVVLGWFRKTDCKKQIWVNCNGYIILMASLKNKCSPTPLGPLESFCKTG